MALRCARDESLGHGCHLPLNRGYYIVAEMGNQYLVFGGIESAPREQRPCSRVSAAAQEHDSSCLSRLQRNRLWIGGLARKREAPFVTGQKSNQRSEFGSLGLPDRRIRHGYLQLYLSLIPIRATSSS